MRKQALHPRTASINRKQKLQSKQERLEALAWLSAKFPQAFDNTTQIRPLKIGIMADVMQHADEAAGAGISKSKLREAVVVFARRLDYLTCLKSREMRVDLEGNAITSVTDEEAERAATKIRKRIEKSIKNAKKQQASVSKLPVELSKKAEPSEETAKPEWDPKDHYPERPSSCTAAVHGMEPLKRNNSSVVIKHKTSRSYDPEIVARLKAKLGIAQKD